MFFPKFDEQWLRQEKFSDVDDVFINAGGTQTRILDDDSGDVHSDRRYSLELSYSCNANAGNVKCNADDVAE